MIIFPNCKINLGLNVTSKRPDGYHNLETVFYPLPLRDILEIIPAPDGLTSFRSTGLPIPGIPEQNLCVKAFRSLADEFHIPPVKIHLHKVVPMGAGLGGGSADCAFTLRLLNELFELRLDDSGMEQLASRLGSDCAFFIRNHPVFATGKGDHFEPVSIDLSAYRIVLVVPPFHVNTALAYAGISPAVPQVSVKNIENVPVEEWKKFLANDFETSVFAKFPEIGHLKEKLYASGALYASMTGSGSAVYGLFAKDQPNKNDFSGMSVWELEL